MSFSHFLKNIIIILNNKYNKLLKSKIKVIIHGDWGLGIGPNPQSPIPNPQSPIPMFIV